MAFHAKAQLSRSNENIQIQSRMIDGKPTIKIFPTNGSVWFKGMKNGYQIAISEYKDNAYSDFKVLEDNLVPAPEDEFKSPALPNEYADAMRRLIYEETYAPEGETFNDRAAASEAMSRKFFFYLLLSSYDPQISEMSGLQIALPQNISDIFKLRIKVNQSAIEYEQNMMRNAFYTTLQSPPLEVKPGDRKVTLSWNHINYKNQFVAYRPERSSDGKNFDKMGAPKIFNANSPAGKLGRIVFNDSLKRNYQPHWYRLGGYDAFGILSEYTEPIKVASRDFTPPGTPESVHVSEGDAPGEVKITWSAETVADLQGFQVIASHSEKGDYQRLHKELLSPETRAFNFKFDTKPLLFYRVLAVDTASNASSSNLGYLVVYDSIPPQIPVKLTAETDTNYVVTIQWHKSESDDVKGYRLYKAFNPAHGFVPVSAQILTDTLFIDSLAADRLEKKVYYQIVALDHHYNHSERSAAIFAPIPDKIAPTAPLLMGAVRDRDNQVTLSWHRSSSADVKNQLVLRRMPEDSASTVIATLLNNDTLYVDKIEEGGGAEYAEYYIAAVDSSGNQSLLSNGKRILFKDDMSLSAISLESAMADEGNISLFWKYPGNGDYDVLVYRAQQDAGFKLVARVNEGDEYIDKSVRSGNEYQYKVGVIKSNGMRTALSEVLKVRVD